MPLTASLPVTKLADAKLPVAKLTTAHAAGCKLAGRGPADRKPAGRKADSCKPAGSNIARSENRPAAARLDRNTARRELRLSLHTTKMQRSDIELMAPVGSYEALAAAIAAGADSIYFGVGKLNMRSASAANFTLDDLARIVATAHAAGVKAYLTVNTVVYEDELRTVHEVIDRARREGVDAIIASDLAAILYARRIGQEVHISTQCNISNSEAVKFYAQWADTVVLARELTLEQVAAIRDAIVENDIRGPRGELVAIEMFAHGALCMAISGKCYLSLYETGCSANRGACRQLCRRKYTVTDTETGAALDIDGRYVLSPKDLCTIDFLDRFLASGVRVLKIEGRARGAEYVRRVVGCYDEAIGAAVPASVTLGDHSAVTISGRHPHTYLSRGE